MSLANKFNLSSFGLWINGFKGRIFRIVAGLAFLSIGVIFHYSLFGKASLIWSFFPLTAGLFDICWVSLVLGGAFKGKDIRESQKNRDR